MGIPEKLLPQGLILAKDFIKALCQVDDERRLGRKEEAIAAVAQQAQCLEYMRAFATHICAKPRNRGRKL